MQNSKEPKNGKVKTLDTLLAARTPYKFSVKNVGAKLSGNSKWFSVSDHSAKNISRLQWRSKTVGMAREHVFDLIVRKEKGKTAWSMITILYRIDKKREKNIYRFQASSGRIKAAGKVRPNMMRIEDKGENWRIVGYAHVPEGANNMDIFLYPAPGKNRTGVLNIKKFSLSEPS